jgi:hypothetical protein
VPRAHAYKRVTSLSVALPQVWGLMMDLICIAQGVEDEDVFILQ